MKFTIIALLALFSFSAMAEDVSSAVTRIEAENGMECTQVSATSKKCINTICLFSEEYFCSNEDNGFMVKIKVLEYTKGNGDRGTKVRGVRISG